MTYIITREDNLEIIVKNELYNNDEGCSIVHIDKKEYNKELKRAIEQCIEYNEEYKLMTLQEFEELQERGERK
ncbi:MAG: hypothetical protein PHX70_14410 [Clostridium sp.]|nr:hypothetical protein [Clostridium sp.]